MTVPLTARAKVTWIEPFEKRGEMDQGILRFTWYSLVLVAKGYALALIIGTPIGFCLGLSKTFTKIFDPIIQILRPVSPLAWLPLGLVLFLAGVGTRSGWVFAQTFAKSGSLTLFLGGTAITLFTTMIALVVGRRVLKVRPSVLFGMVAGIQTQPAVLAFANENAVDDGPNAGYSAVYPFATIAKIILAQILVGS